MNKPAETEIEINKLLKERWSPMAFSTRPVEKEKLLTLFEAARWSPSGGNSQPWNFLVVTRENSGSFQKMVQTLTGKNPLWANQAPVLMLAVAKLNGQRPELNKFAYYDLGQAVSHLTVEAANLGLHVHQMGGFDAKKAAAAFEIPEGYEPVTVVALGYLGQVENLPVELQERARVPRTRKELDEFVFNEIWKNPLALNFRAYPEPDISLSA